jgi:aminomethyltransferase
MLPASAAVRAWRELNAAGVTSCGLGARDTLRLEAGMNLYGNDMDESTHPFESGLAWTVVMQPSERRFIGRDALERVRLAPSRQLVGLILEDRGVLRSHQKVIVADGDAETVSRAESTGRAESMLRTGEITSGTFSPTLERSIALARLPAGAVQQVRVDIRGKLLNAKVVKPPFVRFGKPLI